MTRRTSGATDGFVADVFLGGSFYSCDRPFSRVSRAARFLTRYVDPKVSAHSLDSVADALFREIGEIQPEALRGPVAGDFIDMLKREKDNILHDIRAECARLTPANDSMGLLFRNFKLANRTRINNAGFVCDFDYDGARKVRCWPSSVTATWRR